MLQEHMAKGGVLDTTSIRNLYYIDDTGESETFIYRNGILEENWKIPSFFDISLDSISITRLQSRRESVVISENNLDSGSPLSPEEIIAKNQEITESEKLQIETAYRDLAKRTPIHKRTTRREIEDLLDRKFAESNIDIDYEYAIYAKDLATPIQSESFEYNKENTLGVPIFYDSNNNSQFRLYVNFPERGKFLMSSIIGLTFMSFIFTLIIIIAYVSAIFQLMKQRKISQIKTDFINNMTHEFKTPIATINLALDAIKSPQIISDEDKVKRYLKMIKDENKRMHAQVENVLRISKLEKKDLNISKDRVKLHDLIEYAVTHVSLIIEDRKGYINTHFNALKSSVLANETHFTNVIVNMLDNAIKYSDNEPQIDIYTENVGSNIILSVKDQGSGMSKSVQKKVFDKFYREHTGDVHNVKGHGLGLAYVKRIVEDHQGHVSVESEKGKGSTFVIKLPLIT